MTNKKQYEFIIKALQNLSDEERQAKAWAEHPDNPKFDKEQK